jgi:hypothetical protein
MRHLKRNSGSILVAPGPKISKNCHEGQSMMKPITLILDKICLELSIILPFPVFLTETPFPRSNIIIKGEQLITNYRPSKDACLLVPVGYSKDELMNVGECGNVTSYNFFEPVSVNLFRVKDGLEKDLRQHRD